MSSLPAPTNAASLAEGRETAHAEGLPTRRSEFREFARRIVDDEKYQANLLKAMQDRTASPAVERLVLEAAYCSVKVDEQGGADELRRGETMRAAVEALVKSGKGAELDARIMGARRMVRLPPNAARRVDDGDDTA